ncbi:MAG: hypothetical protein ABWX57_07785 [Aeromicrobium sp.]
MSRGTATATTPCAPTRSSSRTRRPSRTLSVDERFRRFFADKDEAIAVAVRATSGTAAAQEPVDRMVAFSADHPPDDDATVIVRRDTAWCAAR